MVTSAPFPTGGLAPSADFEAFTDLSTADIVLTSAARPAGAQRGLIVTTARQSEGVLVVRSRDGDGTTNVTINLARNISIHLPIQVAEIESTGTTGIVSVLALY